MARREHRRSRCDSPRHGRGATVTGLGRAVGVNVHRQCGTMTSILVHLDAAASPASCRATPGADGLAQAVHRRHADDDGPQRSLRRLKGLAQVSAPHCYNSLIDAAAVSVDAPPLDGLPPGTPTRPSAAMTDKHLTELAWKTFAKSGAYKDAALLKALSALSKAERDGPQAMLDALDDVEKQMKLLRSAHKGNKELTGYLDKVEKAAEAQRKISDKDLKEAEAADDDEDSPALLTSKLVPLIKQVRKGDVVMKAMIVTTGKDTAVMLSKREIAPTRSKLLKEYLGASGGVRTILGDCLLEANAITFVVQSQAAGLAKTLKAALLAQTELRLMVRVRGQDPDDIDEDGEPEEEGQTAPGDIRSETKPDSTADAQQQPDADWQRFEQRLAQLEPLVAAALAAQRGDATKIRAVIEFARERGAVHPASGMKALDSLEALLRAAATPQTTPRPDIPANDVEPGAAFNARLSALLPRIKDFMATAAPQAAEVKLKVSEAGVLARQREFDRAQALLDEAEQLLMGTTPDSGDAAHHRERLRAVIGAWRQASEAVDGQIAALQQVLKGSDDPDLVEIGDFGINALTGNHRVKLMAAVLELERSQDTALRALAQRTLPLAGKLERHLAEDERVAVCDENPFGVQVSIRTTLGGALRELTSALSDVVA